MSQFEFFPSMQDPRNMFADGPNNDVLAKYTLDTILEYPEFAMDNGVSDHSDPSASLNSDNAFLPHHRDEKAWAYGIDTKLVTPKRDGLIRSPKVVEKVGVDWAHIQDEFECMGENLQSKVISQHTGFEPVSVSEDDLLGFDWDESGFAAISDTRPRFGLQAALRTILEAQETMEASLGAHLATIVAENKKFNEVVRESFATIKRITDSI